MSNTKKQSLSTLLQELQRRASAEPLSADEQHAIIQMVTDLLQACGKTVERSLAGCDMGEIRGLAHVKRALEVVAAGGHHLLLSGPSQAGKTVLARTLLSILPATAVPYPFRAPDATLDLTPFVGEATAPGELTLAHGGVLFLKNFHDFALAHLAALRCAIEAHVVALRNGEEYLETVQT